MSMCDTWPLSKIYCISSLITVNLEFNLKIEQTFMAQQIFVIYAPCLNVFNYPVYS